jgi:hypothetical protein
VSELAWKTPLVQSLPALIAHRDQMRIDIAEVEQCIAFLNKLRDQDNAGQEAAVAPESSYSVRRKRYTDLSNATPLETVLAAREKIEEGDKPVPFGILYEYATSLGMQIDSKNPKDAYSGRMRDNAKKAGIVTLPGVGWWSADRPYAPANYPGNDTANTPTGHGNHAS